jgi:hypothetical protein
MRALVNDSRVLSIASRQDRSSHHQCWRCSGAAYCRRVHTLLGHRFVPHAGVLQHISPLATRPSMAVFQVLTKMVGAEKLLGFVAFAKLVNMIEVVGSHVPLWGVWEFVAAIPAYISESAGERGMKGGLGARQCCTQP